MSASRLIIIVAAAAALLTLAADFAVRSLPTAGLSARLSREIAELSGYGFTHDGQIRASLLPSPRIVADGARLVSPTGADILRADRLVARPRLLPLLIGRLDADSITVVRPLLSMAAEGDSWLGDRLARIASRSRAAAAHPIRLNIKEGRLRITNHAQAPLTEATSIEAHFVWPGSDADLDGRLRFVWRGEAVEGRGALTAPTAQNAATRIRIEAHGTPARLAFDGGIAETPGRDLTGTLQLSGPSLRAFSRWIGREIGSGTGLGPFTVAGQLERTAQQTSLSAARIEVDRNAFSGVLTLARGERRSLRGTLSAEHVDILPYTAALSPLLDARNWRRTPLAAATGATTDLDLRLTANTIQAGSTRFGPAAASVRRRDDVLTLQLDDAEGFKGKLFARLDVKPADGGGAGLRLEATADRVDAAAALAAVGSGPRLEGSVTAGVVLQGRGTSLDALIASLSGQLRISAHRGALVGVNIDGLLQRLASAPLTASAAARGGRTAFLRAGGEFEVSDGRAHSGEVVLESPTLRMNLTGTVDILQRRVAFAGTAALLAPAAGEARPGARFELPLAIEGPWDGPQILPDPGILIRRSGAAAPLLGPRALGTRARGLIDRIAGGTDPAGEAAAEPR